MSLPQPHGQDASVPCVAAHKVLIDWAAFDLAEPRRVHPPPVKKKTPKGDQLSQDMHAGMAALKALNTSQPAKTSVGVTLLMPHLPGEKPDSDADDVDVVSGESGSSSDDAPIGQLGDDVIAAPVGKKKAEVFLVHGGQLLINTSGSSIDAKCLLCGAGADRTFKGRAQAKQLHTKAQGRPMGSHLLWLSLDCNGNADWHNAQYSHANLQRAARILRRKEAIMKGWCGSCFDRERSPRTSESEGEPRGVTTSWRK